MSVPDFQAAIRTWLSDATGQTVLNGHSKAPKQPGTSVTVTMTAAVPRGTPDADPILSTSDKRQSRQQYRGSFSCQFWGPDAQASAFAAHEALGLESTLDKFRVASIGYQGKGAINNLPVLVNGDWEKRQQFDVFFGFQGSVEETLYWIEKLKDVTYTVHDIAGADLLTGTFDVP